MKIKKGVRTFTNLIIWILVILLLVGVFGFIYKQTDGLESSLKTFCVEYEDEEILNEKLGLRFACGNTYNFGVNRKLDLSLGDSDEKSVDYTVKVLPSVTDDTDFSFTLRGVFGDSKLYKFSEVGDLTECFDIKTEYDGFSITVPDSFEKMLGKKEVFSDYEIVIDDEINFLNDLFVIEVVSNDGQAVHLYFGFDRIDKIILDKTELIF